MYVFVSISIYYVFVIILMMKYISNIYEVFFSGKTES